MSDIMKPQPQGSTFNSKPYKKMKKTITKEEAEAIIAQVEMENKWENERREEENFASQWQDLRAEYCTAEEDYLEVCEADEADRLYVSCMAWTRGEAAQTIIGRLLRSLGLDEVEPDSEVDGLHDEYGVYFKLEK